MTITETITFNFDDEAQQKRFHDRLDGKDDDATWRDASAKLCDALDSILYEDSDKSEQARLTDRVIASELLHIVREKLLPQDG